MDAEEEARRRKLEAGRAKFTYLRQRKPKSDITQSQKKTAKRKGSSVHTHDVPKEEYAVATQGVGKGIESKPEDTNLLETTTETEGSADLSNWDVLDDHVAEKVMINSAAEDSELDTKMCQARIAELENRLLKKQEAVERFSAQMDELQEQLTQHSDSMQLQETTVQEQNEVTRKLTSCLQQAKKDPDDLQEEASHVVGQVHDLQLQLRKVNEMLKSKSPGKKEVLEAQQQMYLFQNSLKEQNAHLEMLRQKAHDLEVQLESSENNTKDKENLLCQMEEDMKDPMQQLYKSIGEKEQHIKSLQDLLASERFRLSILQRTVSLQDSEITELKNEAALSKMKEQQRIEELKISHEKDICRQLENLRAELEKCHRREIAEAKQVYEKEITLKYKNELEQLKRELCALNSEEHIQDLNGIIINLNNSLRESEINKESLRRKLENQQEDFQREKSEIETKYKDLIDGLKSQLSNAEEQVKEAQRYKQEKQSLNEEIQKLNYFIQELNEKRLYEAEKSIDVRQKHNEEIVSNKKLMKLRENQILPEVSQLQRAELEEMWNKLHQLKGEDELVHEELEFQCDLGVDSSRDQLEEIKNSKVTENNESSEGYNLSEEHLSGLGLFSGDEGILAKYLISTEQPEESYASSASEGYSIEEGRCSRYGLDSSVLLESNRDFIPPPLNFGLDEETSRSGLAQETFEETEVGAEGFVSFLSDSSLQQNKISDHSDVKDDETTCLIERCVKLTEQLHEKESALKKSCQETQEAVGKCEKVMAELSHIRVELGEEREARIRCEKELLQKTEKEKERENKMMFLVKQQAEDGGQPYCAVEPLTQVSKSSAWQEMVKDLQEEREMLMVQLRTQEQLVKDVQEQKTASDSVTSEVQSLFGRQLAALQSQRDQMQNQLDAQKAKNQTIAELLGQKTLSEETLLQEQKLLKAEINNKEQNLVLLLKEKTALGERLSDVEEDLIKAEKALAENASIIEDLEKNIHELNAEIKNLKEIQECERQGYEDRLNLSNLEIHKLIAEIKAKSTEYSEEKSQLAEEIAHLKKVHLELETRLQESFQAAQAAQEAQSEMVKHYKKEMETQHLAELTKIEELNAEIKDKVEKQQKLEEERKEQIALIKKVHEREHDREISELITKHEEEMEKLRAELNKEQQQMAATHKAEMEQAQLQSQTLHSLELETLRLSLNNMRTSQLELTQSNLRKEKETALMELREMLNDKHAQDVAILQSRHQMEWEKIKEQCLKEKEDLKSKYRQELVDQRKKIELEMEETHIQALETLKRDWELESEMRLKSTCEELSEKHQTEMVELQKTLKMDLEKVKTELGLLSLENEQSKKLEKQHQLAITKLQVQLQTEYNQLLEDMKMKSQEKEQNLQEELEKLQVVHEELKTRSQEEIRQLWSQLDNTRANRQELSDGEARMQAHSPELKEQLLARASRVEEIEHLKQEFEQQHQQRKSEHETELEQLRLYFEKKLRVAEENYREELTLLHQRLQEQKEYSLSELEVSQDQAGDISSSVTVFEETEKERRDRLGQLSQQLEQHQEGLACLHVQLKEQHRHELESLRFSLALQYKEDLLKMKMDLSDKYVTEIEEMKRKHCLELEQLRAQLSEEHIKEITKLRLQSAQDAARQVEMEVAERVSVLEEEHKAKLALLHSEKQHIAELLEEIKHLKEEITKQKDFSVQNEKHLKEEMEKVKNKIAEDHKNKLREAREEVQKMETMYKEKEKIWKCESEDQRIQAEEKLSLLRIELKNRAEYEKQNLQKEFELREAEMNQLQDHQAAKILELEKLVKEQQNNLQQLEDSLANAQAQAMQKSREQYESDLQAAKVLMANEMEKATLCLQEECTLKLLEAQNKFMEEHKAMTQKFTTEQEILLQELKKKHVDELELQSQQLQEKHKQQILSLTAEFQAKHQAEIETLKSTLESKQQIQLEARVAELQAKHQAQTDELEAKHLSNLDSLESSYLSEIQNIRDEHSQALEKLQLQHTEQLHEKDKMDQARLVQEIEMLKLKHAEELQLSQNNLKIELATVHMEKLKAMALEAEAVHKVDLNTALQNQRRLLEEEKRLALDVLREEVLYMEEKHRKALKELQDLHEAEIKKHKEEYSRELETELGKLKAQHEREQEMYASASATEVESVRTALLAQFEEVKLKQQLQFQEEIELLKCQSEVLLEQQIAQLKDEFEAEKKASLHDKEQMLIQEMEKAQAAHQKEQEMLSAQLQEKAAIIIQLEKKAESLNREIEETSSELETLLQRRDRENQEGGNLVDMLRSDMEQSKDERKKLQESYQHVLKLLIELVKATIAIEDLICSKIGLCLDDSLTSGDSRESHIIMEEMGFMQYFKAKEKHHLEKVDELLDETLTEHNQLSPVTDEGSELSQYLCESVFAKPELACENEEMILKICHRLRTAVERLLELVTESTKQLEKMHENHVQFKEEFSRRNQETAQVVSQHQELMECLSEENEAKNQLALELHKAEGIIEGYVAEKAALEEALNLKEESERRLVVELENMRERFQELTQDQAILGTPVANVAQKEGSGLLKEVEYLTKEKLELQCQAEKDHSNLRSQMKVLEVELEEQLHSNQDLATQLLEVAELKQQIQVLEKQLKNQRQFMDEQAIEREHERDDFQQEIQKLEKQLKLSAKSQTSGEPREYGNYELILQVESLQAEIKEKMDDYNKLLLEKDQKHQEITARDKEIEKLVAQIQELECGGTEVSKTIHYLEQQLQKMKKVEIELKQDKEALQQQQYNNLIQISALQSKLDEARHRVPADSTSAPVLKERLQAEQEALQTKEREIASLLDQLEQYKDNLISKNKEILQLNLQLEMQKNLSTSSISQLQLESAHLKEDLTKLRVKQNQDLGISDSSALSFPQALLKEKNEEIDHLNEQMKRLQNELENTRENKVVEDQKSEIEELRSLVEHLRGDQERLRKDKDEEVEQLHGVIEKLQKELAQFGPVCHEVSDNQDDLYQLALGKPVENLQNELMKGLVDCQGDTDPNRRNELLLSKMRELQEELELVLAAREALQQKLEEKELQFKMEVEILEKKCHKLRESSEQHVAELTSLRIQYDALQEEYSLSQTHFSQREVEAKMTTSRIQELEDTVREREANILEKDMQMKTMADQREAATTELQYLTKKAAELQTELEKRDASQAQDVYSLQLEVSRLGIQVQALNQKEVAYQREINELKGSTAKLKDQIEAYVKELETLRLERGELISQLESYKPKEQRDHEETNLLKPFCQRERKGVALKKGGEELEELEANTDQSFAVLAFPTDKLEKDEVMFDLRTHNINPKTQIKQSQEHILTRELDVINSSKEEQDLKKHCQQMLEIHQTPDSPKHNLNIGKDTSKDFQNFIAGMASWGSPEIMRKQDTSMELQPVLHLTPFSEVESTDFEMMHTRSSVQEDNSVLLGYSNLYENGSEEAAVGADRKSPAFSESTYSDDQDMEKKILMREADNLTLTPSDLQDDVRSRASAIDAMSDGYGSNTSSNLAAKLKQELQTSDHLNASFMAYLQYRGMFPDIMEPMREKEVLSPQLKTVLKMVYEESRKILALSERPFGFRELENVHQTRVAMEGWQKEGLALLDAIQSLRDYLSKVAERGDKQEHSGIAADWRGELLQAVQSVFEKERNVLQMDLKSHFSSLVSGDEGSLAEKLEYVMKQQEEQRQMVVEHLFSSDRNSLLSEIQDLRAQLRMTHLQNQEKLQQLQETLINVEDHGSKQEHHLRRKVELLEYKLQEEKSVVSDLQCTLTEEQKRASETSDLLNQEKAALKSELYESKQENEKLQKSLEELQREINQLRCELEKKEKDLTAALEDLQAEHHKETELRGLFEEQQLQHKKAEDEKTKALEELQAALELQSVQNSQLAVSLEHEQMVNDNLRKELQIEHSRCEALLSQEQAKLLELQRNLDAEKNRSLELLNSLNHERVLTEQLSVRVKEGAACQHRESLLEQAFVRELQAQLEEERSRTMELSAIVEKMHQKAILSKRQLEAEVQMCCKETQKEREVSEKLRAALESLQGQKQEVIRSLEAQKEREAKLKADWEQLQLLFKTMKEQDKNKKEEREQERRQQQQTELEKQKDWQRDQERLQNLEWQHQRDQQRIKELQEILAILEERERNLPPPNHQQELLCTLNKDRNAKQATTRETEKSPLQQQQQLEKIRQQLLSVAVQLNEFICKTVDKTVHDWSASNDEAVASLLQTLKEVKSDLLSLPASQIRSADDTDSVQELERDAWQRERTILQNSLKQAESELAKATLEFENKPVAETSSPKLQRLYRKYLRAESFRKALVYQKKYLLLLLGGFQDCEQATLSLIARMGIYPSPVDLQLSGSHSRPFTKFRCAVRAIIAVSRLKFLVKKWNKVCRKSAQGETVSHSIGGNTACGARTEVLKEQQPPAVHLGSPPTRDTGLCHRTNSARLMSSSPRSSRCLNNRLHPSTSSASEKSLVPTQDPERSLTEYIHRLEVIQQRLGGVQPGQVPGPPRQRNVKK
ncbi:pericentrin isoform X2 [Nyctibius grandis]|uniref:pericentrin isoform X2 n=1 Tax=Nyctibius grandis TaxID=48427 RepID=UPI0035BC80DF